MERTTSINRAKEIMGKNFIGIDELLAIRVKMGIHIPEDLKTNCPSIHFSEETLKKNKNEYILILGVPYYKDKTPLTIVKMREHFGVDPGKSEPCFYNQDWYLNEEFALSKTFNLDWYFVRKNVYDDFRGKDFATISCKLSEVQKFPSAVLLTYIFFSYYFASNLEILWKHDFIWCEDTDNSEDQIYVGKYYDPNSLNRNGFNIHRHLNIRKNYSAVDSLICELNPGI